MIKQRACDVCKQQHSKYRCPQCRILYCTLACFKAHSEEMCELEKQKLPPPTPVFTLPVVSEKERSESPEDGEITDDEESVNSDDAHDRVPKENLERLSDSKELKTLLENPHLRQMVVSLSQTKDAARGMEAAMQEPIFVEFADRCLQIVVDTDNNG